jgi:hypothetical protein
MVYTNSFVAPEEHHLTFAQIGFDRLPKRAYAAIFSDEKLPV